MANANSKDEKRKKSSPKEDVKEESARKSEAKDVKESARKSAAKDVKESARKSEAKDVKESARKSEAKGRGDDNANVDNNTTAAVADNKASAPPKRSTKKLAMSKNENKEEKDKEKDKEKDQDSPS